MARGRIPKPWLRKSTGTWYTWLDGKQVALGKGKREAHAEFARLTVHRGKGAAGGRIAVRQLADLWLAGCERELAPSTFRNYRAYVESFCLMCGSLRASDLRPYHATTWADAQRTARTGKPWSKSTYHLAYTTLKVMTAWAEARGYLDADPLRRLRRPEIARRAPITPAEAAAIIAAVRPEIATALRLLLVTGLRPGEMCSMTVERTSVADRKASVAGKTGPRSIPLSDASCAILEPLLGKRASGPVLLNSRGGRLTVWVIQHDVIDARRRVGLGEHVTPHCFRGLFSTEALRRGVDSALVSKLLGHKDPSVLMKHYASPDDQMMQDAANKATRPVKS